MARLFAKVRKAGRLLSRRRFALALLHHGVAAAVEHLTIIRDTRAATLIDVGANKGQFSLAFRVLRPKATIIAFEPLEEAAAVYRRVLKNDDLAELHNIAISNRKGEAELHITSREDSSSLLTPGDGQLKAYGIRKNRSIIVRTNRLDACIVMANLPHPIFMKIDVQGGELEVLQSATELEQIDFIYVELSFVELYVGQPLFEQVVTYLRERGFVLKNILNVSVTNAFGPTQADCLFGRPDSKAQQ